MSTTVCRVDYHVYDRNTEEFGITFVIESNDGVSEYFIENPNLIPKSEWMAFYHNIKNSFNESSELKISQCNDDVTISANSGVVTFETFPRLNGKSSRTSIPTSYVAPLLSTLIDRLGYIRN